MTPPAPLDAALRVLGLASRSLAAVSGSPSADEVESDLTFLGLVGMIDPARPETAGAVARAREAGITVVMITGDYPRTAAALETTRVFARVAPQHKVRLVDALQGRGHVVGMTGDGVNDAPALRRAHIGIAMGITGTDVTRETADMVLTDDNFASIVSAVEQGRVIFSNIRKFEYFLLSCNLGEIGTIFIATLLGWPIPLTAIQLLWMNLLTDGAPALALGMEKGEPGIMERPPRPPREPLINRTMVLGLTLQSAAITAATLLSFWIGLTVFGAEDVARTMAFVMLSGCQLARVYTNRSERASLVSLGVLSNRWMQYAVLVSAALLVAAVYVPGLNTVLDAVPLAAGHWAWLAPLLFLPALVDEATKAVLRASDRRRRAR